jgi:DDE superfamily endonuclease
MPEPTSTSSASPTPPPTPLLEALRHLLLSHRCAFRQERTFLRAQALLFGHLFAFARRTITQALVALGLTDSDWSAFYRLFSIPRIDYELLSGRFFEEILTHVVPSDPFVAVVDGVQVARHSHKMAGTSWLKNPRTPPFMPGIHRAQRFLHLAALLPKNEQGYSRAIPLRWEPSFPEKAVAGAAEPKKEWEAGLEAIRWLRERLDGASRRNQQLLVVGDGTYCTADLLRRLPERVTLLARCAKNRALYELPTPQQQLKGRGRRRKYGARSRYPHQWLGERYGFRQARMMVRGRQLRLRFRVEGPFVLRKAAEQPVYLLVVKGVKRHSSKLKREPTYWLVSACKEAEEGKWVTAHEAEQLLAWAWQRWEVEVSHREMKSSFGLGEIQCWNARSVVMAVRWQAWCYGVMVLAGYRAWGLSRGSLRPGGRWWGGSGRWSLGTLWRGYRRELWGTEQFRPLWTGTGGNDYEKEAHLLEMNNAEFRSLRG